MIEIAGGIAAGKTTLARLLANHGYAAVFESFRANPFWQAFYTEPGKHIFETELTFLLQHYHWIKSHKSKHQVVCDFSLYLDLAYADIGLKGRRRSIFEDVHTSLRAEIGYPEILIYLRCKPEEQLRRIMARGRETERGITIDFLRALNDAVESIATTQTDSRMIQIDSSSTDFAHDLEIQQSVIRCIGLASFTS